WSRHECWRVWIGDDFGKLAHDHAWTAEHGAERRIDRYRDSGAWLSIDGGLHFHRPDRSQIHTLDMDDGLHAAWHAKRKNGLHNRNRADVQPVAKVTAAAILLIADAEGVDTGLSTDVSQRASAAFAN